MPTPAQVVIIATSLKDSTKTGTATVTITKTSQPSNVTVQVSPATVSIANYSTQLFTATVSGSTNTACDVVRERAAGRQPHAGIYLVVGILCGAGKCADDFGRQRRKCGDDADGDGGVASEYRTRPACRR